MESLQSLVTLAKDKVRDIQLSKSKIEERIQDLHRMREQLLTSLAHEQDVVSKMPDPLLLNQLSLFEQSTNKTLKLLAEQEAQFVYELQTIEDNLQEAFIEYKSYDIMHQRKIKRQKQALAKQEAKALDEMIVMRESLN